MSVLFWWTRVVAALLVIIAAATGYLVWLLRDVEATPRTVADVQGDAARGAYLARLAGCVACHTGAGKPFLGGGDAIVTAHGQFHAPNITSDVNFGIGAWTLDQFAAAVIDGRAPDGRHYYPVFPYQSYGSFDDQDIADLWAALQTVTPAQTEVPAHRPAISLLNRPLVGPWKRLTSLHDDLAQRDQPVPRDRGRYIALGPGLCVHCHSPRNALGSIDSDRVLQGGSANGTSGAAPSLMAEDLIGRGWTAETLLQSLEDGHGLDGKRFRAPMDKIASTATAFLSGDDREALVRFLLGGDGQSRR